MYPYLYPSQAKAEGLSVSDTNTNGIRLGDSDELCLEILPNTELRNPLDKKDRKAEYRVTNEWAPAIGLDKIGGALSRPLLRLV
ncbi:hypothetical protein ACFLWO_02435 [Chloroflexota bacterium]